MDDGDLMADYTARAIIVAKPAFANAANQAAAQIDTDGGAQTFTVPLRRKGDATNAIRAYWCGWAMRSPEVTALRNALKAKGATDAEAVVVSAADLATFVPVPTARVYFFDAREGVGWTAQQVLDALNLDTIDPPKP